MCWNYGRDMLSLPVGGGQTEGSECVGTELGRSV